MIATRQRSALLPFRQSQRFADRSVSPIMSSMSSSTTESSAAAPAGGSAAPVAPSATARVPLFTAEAWAPLKVDLFRSLWVATLIAQIGTWAREAAVPALMSNLTNGLPTKAEWVGRVLVCSNLPIR